MSDDPPPPPPASLDLGLAMVIDNGTGMTKAGQCGATRPSISIPTIVGHPAKRTRIIKRKTVSEEEALPDVMVGDDVRRNATRLDVVYPMDSGDIKDWDAMGEVWKYCYREMEFEPSEYPVLITEPPMNPRQTRERTMEFFFEQMQVPYYCAMLGGVCALYASGRTTGVVLDVGEGVTHTVPVFDSFPLANAIHRHGIAGRKVTEHLMRILCDRGYNFTTNSDREICRQVKESLCFVQHGNRDASADGTEASYTMPDGQVVTLGDERFRAPEILFNTSLVNSEVPGLHQMVSNSVQACGIDVRRGLMSNIVLSGGSSMFDGMGARLSDELGLLHGGMFQSIRVIDAKDRDNNVWVGASVIASLGNFSQMCIDKEKYDEVGPSCLKSIY